MKYVSKRRIIVLLSITAFVVAPLAAFLYWANTPAEQTAVIGRSDSRDIEIAYQPIETSHFRTMLPEDYIIQVTEKTGSHLVQLFAYERSAKATQIGVLVNTLPSDGLAGVADYNLRVSDTTSYERTQEPPSRLNEQVFFSSADSSQKTAFIVSGNLYASIGVSGITTSDESATVLEAVLTNWQWK